MGSNKETLKKKIGAFCVVAAFAIYKTKQETLQC